MLHQGSSRERGLKCVKSFKGFAEIYVNFLSIPFSHIVNIVIPSHHHHQYRAVNFKRSVIALNLKRRTYI